MIFLHCILSIAQADVAPRPSQDAQFTEHRLSVENLEDHPEWIVVIHSTPRNGEISTHRALSSETATSRLARGGSPGTRGDQIWAPQATLMSREDYTAWNELRLSLTEEQQAACRRGEGCAHISRFVPRFPVPTPGVQCTLDLPPLAREVPRDQPAEVTHRFELQIADDGSCSLIPEIAQGGTDGRDSWSPMTPATGLAGLLAGWLLVRRERSEG